MSFYIGQLGAKIGKRQKPNGPFWSGQHWSKFEHRKSYASEEDAAADFEKAHKSAQNAVAIFSTGGTVTCKLKPRRA